MIRTENELIRDLIEIIELSYEYPEELSVTIYLLSIFREDCYINGVKDLIDSDFLNFMNGLFAKLTWRDRVCNKGKTYISTRYFTKDNYYINKKLYYTYANNR